VFVAGDHHRSFDSKYNEFGLVKRENIKGRSFALW
jgi:type IV secretory pathway protease TraF